MSFNDPDWLDASTTIDGLLFDIFFELRDELYVGPDRILDEAQYRAAENNFALTLPAIPRLETHAVSSSEATGSEVTLGDYYKRLIAAARDRLARDPDASYFWIRPRAWNSAAEVGLIFPWYDSLDEARAFADQVCGGGDGSLMTDIDQGWEFDAFGRSERIHFRIGDGEGEYHTNFSIPREPFCSDVRAAIGRTADLVARLTAIVGRDYWTTWNYLPDIDLDLPSS